MMAKKYDIRCIPVQEKPVYFVFEANGDTDSHGLFGFVRTVDVEDRVDQNGELIPALSDAWWREVLPEAFGTK